jgi:hypothetical protein
VLGSAPPPARLRCRDGIHPRGLRGGGECHRGAGCFALEFPIISSEYVYRSIVDDRTSSNPRTPRPRGSGIPAPAPPPQSPQSARRYPGARPRPPQICAPHLYLGGGPPDPLSGAGYTEFYLDQGLARVDEAGTKMSTFAKCAELWLRISRMGSHPRWAAPRRACCFPVPPTRLAR